MPRPKSSKKKVKKTLCVCLKCNKKFLSSDEMDIEDGGWCTKCKKEKAEIAKKIDAEFKLRKVTLTLPQVRTKEIYFEAGN